MARKTRLHLRAAAAAATAAAVLGTTVWMLVTRSGRMWAWLLALLCVFAVALRGYALEWRRLRDGERPQ